MTFNSFEYLGLLNDPAPICPEDFGYPYLSVFPAAKAVRFTVGRNLIFLLLSMPFRAKMKPDFDVGDGDGWPVHSTD